MQNKFYVLKKEELISLLKEIQIPIHDKLNPLGDDSFMVTEIDNINNDIKNIKNLLSSLNKHKYYTNPTYKVIYVKIPRSPKEVDLKLIYTFKDKREPSKTITSVTALYIARPFIDTVSNSGVLNMGTNREGISYLSSMNVSIVKDTLNNHYIKVEIGENRNKDITFATMYAALFSESHDYEILDETIMGAVILTTVTTISLSLEAPTLQPIIEDADKLVRSNDYKWIKSLTEDEFQTLKRAEQLKEDYLYTTDKIDED